MFSNYLTFSFVEGICVGQMRLFSDCIYVSKLFCQGTFKYEENIQIKFEKHRRPEVSTVNLSSWVTNGHWRCYEIIDGRKYLFQKPEVAK